MLTKMFLEHVMRRNKLEKWVTTGNLKGTRARGRQEKYLGNMVTWHNLDKNTDVIQNVGDQVREWTIVLPAWHMIMLITCSLKKKKQPLLNVMLLFFLSEYYWWHVGKPQKLPFMHKVWLSVLAHITGAFSVKTN